MNVVADAPVYDEQTRRGVYTGQARLFQGDTVIQADTLTLDESKGDLTATGKVVTTLVIAGSATPAGVKPKSTFLRAGAFTYGDQDRKAVYTTLARMNGEQADLNADTITLSMAPGESITLSDQYVIPASTVWEFIDLDSTNLPLRFCRVLFLPGP